ncbi:hypothetical protein B0I31_102147 [Saccharothrix carnea]|uniref:Glucose/sorbosone dehydrogenase n=1 Tax=Saccharothrix carnea TaxID=1280637 RepID=A0A2P8IFB4_SACCR|nr:hypothetical protein [Saccharothrix carnea]PSL57169.1 hypothetical protein B0I31_102147 [Saccharothrix carnea]
MAISIGTHAVTDRDGGPDAITTGPDGALWIALETGALARVARP